MSIHLELIMFDLICILTMVLILLILILFLLHLLDFWFQAGISRVVHSLHNFQFKAIIFRLFRHSISRYIKVFVKPIFLIMLSIKFQLWIAKPNTMLRISRDMKLMKKLMKMMRRCWKSMRNYIKNICKN